jgi:dTDP-4-dehydrorhamnose 3,5-epimerase
VAELVDRFGATPLEQLGHPKYYNIAWMELLESVRPAYQAMPTSSSPSTNERSTTNPPTPLSAGPRRGAGVRRGHHRHPTKKLEGVVLIDTDFFRDERGFFIEGLAQETYRKHGLDFDFVQDNHSRSKHKVLRGFHYQDMTAPMGKLIRCTSGGILDVAVDLRVGSPTFGQWAAAELSADNMRQIYVPVGFGHAFVTLSDFSEVQYKCTGLYTPASEGTVAWNDPEIGVEWPFDDPVLSGRDREGMSLERYLESPAFRYG